MYWDVIDVKVEGKLLLKVRFADGTTGRVRFSPKHLTGVFTALEDPDFFSKVFIEAGTVAWPDEIDLAPDAMYREIKKHGEWYLE